MKWVLLFFCTFLGLILLIIFFLTLSTIKLNIKRIYLSNYDNGKKKEKLENEVMIYLEIYLFRKIRVKKINLNQNIFSKMNIKTDMQNLRKNIQKIKKAGILEIIKKSKLEIEKAYLNAQIGADDVILTGYLVSIISSIARNTFQTFRYKKYIL